MCAGRTIVAGIGAVLGLCLLGANNAGAFSASYDQRITQGRQVIQGKVTMKDQLFRMEATVEGQETVTIRNGSGVYTCLPKEHTAMKMSGLNPSQQPIDHADNYQAYLKERQAQRIGTETLAGHACEVYRFTDPTVGGMVTAWVWTEKQFPIKMEMAGPQGTTVIELSNIQLGVAVPETAFQLPPDVQVMDMGALLQAQ